MSASTAAMRFLRISLVWVRLKSPNPVGLELGSSDLASGPEVLVVCSREQDVRVVGTVQMRQCANGPGLGDYEKVVVKFNIISKHGPQLHCMLAAGAVLQGSIDCCTALRSAFASKCFA